MLEDYLTEKEYEELERCVEGEIELIDCPTLYDKLYEYYVDDMPYGTAKGKTGEPYDWILEHVEEDM